MVPVVIDLSHHNTIPSSLKPAAAAGIIGCIHKATEGGSYVDTKVASRYQLAKDASMLWGVYHFLRPGAMQEQVEHFLKSSASVVDDQSIFVADHEDPAVDIDDLLEFLAGVEAKTGRVPVIYSGHVLKDQVAGKINEDVLKYPLWLCHYTTGTPKLPAGFEKYWLWQYTDNGDCDGINSPVDLNAISVPVDEFRAGWPMRKGGIVPPSVDDGYTYTTIRIRSTGPITIEAQTE